VKFAPTVDREVTVQDLRGSFERMVVEPLAPATFFSTGIAGTHATPEVLQRFPATVMVAMFGIFCELLIGIPVGMMNALRQYSIRGRTFTVLSLVFLSILSFVLGMMLMYFLAYKLQIFPLGGYEVRTAPLHGILPGLGWQAWNAIRTQDLPLIMGTVLFAALLVTVSNFVVDLAYTWLDPRVKYG
jgi:ABC-type dipeptide/oligopeptide/nickel transport system permease component